MAVDATPLIGPRTGVGAFCAGALAGLAERADVVVDAFAVTWRRRRWITASLPDGVRAAQRPMPARPLRWAWSRSELPPLEWFVGPHDVVHGTNFVVPPARRAARVVTVQDLTVVRFPELRDPGTAAYPALIRRAIGAGAWIQTPSRFVAEEVVEVFGAPPERVRAVHYGVPPLGSPDGRSPSARAIGAPARARGTERYVLAVGTIEPRKDYPLLLAAFAEVASDRRDVALVIVGAEGWGTEQFRAALDALPGEVAERVVVTGFVDDEALGVILADAAVLAYPSIYEGFGFPPLQAMAAGVPVVATSAGSVPEVVGDAADLVCPGDRDGLAAALDRALEGGPAVSARVERGRARAERFTWEACGDGLVALYRDAVADRAS